MQPSKRRRRSQRDMFALGGWLFADLLLGLAMIFAVANTVGQAPPTPTPTASPDLLATANSDLAFQQASSEQTIAAITEQLSASERRARETEVARQAQFASATETAIADATRQSMTEDERATVDADATQAALAADATIAALASEQALSSNSLDELNRQLATNVAAATEAAIEIDQMKTEQANVAMVATQNASSGANARATSAAAATQLSENNELIAQMEVTTESMATEVVAAQEEANAANSDLANAVATSEALQEQVALNSLNPTSVEEVLLVNLDGVLAGDDQAVDDAVAALQTVLTPYLEGTNCRIGFVNIASRSRELGEGVRLSAAISLLIEEHFPELLPVSADGSMPQLASEAIAMSGTTPTGEVHLQLFLSVGCRPAG